MTKKCTKCEKIKQIKEFYKHDKYKDGYRNHCKTCLIKINSQFAKTNPNRHLYTRKWQKKNQKKMKAYFKKYRKTKLYKNPIYRLKSNLRRRLRSALKGNFKKGSAIRDLGCSILELKIYFETLFQPGMTWKNYGKWHIDHIIPLSRFDLTKSSELKKACHYTNLQPLWAKEHLVKSITERINS